ncbi:MAG: bifunctional riboflavin kinase/FAD synthetase [Acidobacteriota bacterium]|nr:bifunctional riboflavin kinase/FAD synthetase [Acidobacteriota bacterium]
MRVINDLRELDEQPAPSVVTIGNFDGVHLAHQTLLRRVVEVARPQGLQAAAITFEPHPIKILSPDHAPKLLTPLPRKVELIAATGIDLLVVLPFTRELARQSPLEFVRRALLDPLHASSVHVGPNFRFGYRQSGDTEVLEELGNQEGFRVEVVPMLVIRGDRVSSTRIRELLAEGHVHKANRLLGRPFSARGPIVAGMGVGRKHTVPTLNLAPIEEQLPKVGVYVTHTVLAGVAHDSVTNVGFKPTFGDHRLTVETFLLDFSGQIDESDMEIKFLYRLRDEMKFQNPAILKVQIQEDARRSLKFFRLLKQYGQRPNGSGSQLIGSSGR